jgi:hypothetical protein
MVMGFPVFIISPLVGRAKEALASTVRGFFSKRT